MAFLTPGGQGDGKGHDGAGAVHGRCAREVSARTAYSALSFSPTSSPPTPPSSPFCSPDCNPGARYGELPVGG